MMKQISVSHKCSTRGFRSLGWAPVRLGFAILFFSASAWGQGFEVFLLNNSAQVRVYEAHVSVSSYDFNPEVTMGNFVSLPLPHAEVKDTLGNGQYPNSSLSASFHAWQEGGKPIRCQANFDPAITNHAYIVIATDADHQDYCKINWDRPVDF